MADYTTLANLKIYNDTNSNTNDTLLLSMISAVSAEIDMICNYPLGLGQQTLTNQVLRATIDSDGIITCYPPFPVISNITACAWKPGTSLTYQAIDPTQLEVEEARHGCIVRWLGTTAGGGVGGGGGGLYNYRQSARRFQMQLSYTGGYPVSTVLTQTAVAAVPSDLEMACRRLTEWEYKLRSADMGKTAAPEFGVLVIPQAWPRDVLDKLAHWKRWYTH